MVHHPNCLPMPLERVLLLLHLWLGVKVLDSDATFNRGGGVALAVGHAGEEAGHVFEGGFALLGGCVWVDRARG